MKNEGLEPRESDSGLFSLWTDFWSSWMYVSVFEFCVFIVITVWNHGCLPIMGHQMTTEYFCIQNTANPFFILDLTMPVSWGEGSASCSWCQDPTAVDYVSSVLSSHIFSKATRGWKMLFPPPTYSQIWFDAHHGSSNNANFVLIWTICLIIDHI